MTLPLWIALGVGTALLGLALLWFVTRGRGQAPQDVMERLAGSSERPPAFGRPSASVWDKESASAEVLPEDDERRRRKGSVPPEAKE